MLQLFARYGRTSRFCFSYFVARAHLAVPLFTRSRLTTALRHMPAPIDRSLRTRQRLSLAAANASIEKTATCLARCALAAAASSSSSRSADLLTPIADNELSNLHGALVCVTEHEGRYLVASADLPIGRTVYSGNAFAFALHGERILFACACCFKTSSEELTVRCKRCACAYYCSESCRDAHEHIGVARGDAAASGSVPHKLVCPALRLLDPDCLDDEAKATESDAKTAGTLLGFQDVEERLMLELMARRQLQAAAAARTELCSPDEFDKLQFHRQATSWQLGADGTDDEDSSEALLAAVGGDLQEWFAPTGRRFSSLDDGWCDALRLALAECEWAATLPASSLTNESLHQMASRIDVNAFEVGNNDGRPLGIGLYLGGATLFNHSCEPNCEVNHDVVQSPRTVQAVRTTRSVAKGEPLTISYVHVDGFASHVARRRQLKRSYGFECRCSRCIREEDGHERLAGGGVCRLCCWRRLWAGRAAS